MTPLDQPYATVLQKLPRLAFADAMRQDIASLAEAKRKFLTDGSIPAFTYSNANGIDVAFHQKSITRAREDISRIALDHRLTKLYDELLQEREYRLEAIAGVQQRDDEAVTVAAQKLFGQPIESPADLLADLRRAPLPDRASTSRIITSKELIVFATALFAAYDMHTAEVRITDRQSVRTVRTPKHSVVLHVPENYARSEEQTIKMLTHEIEVHALRTVNGVKSTLRLLTTGMPGYLATDEGLALFFEHEEGTMLTPGFWNALAASLSTTTTFAETFAVLTQAKRERAERIGDTTGVNNAPEAAWNLCVRAYRGITHPNTPGLGYFRDHIYRSGYLAVVHHVAAQPEDLGMLFSGHCSLAHLPLLRDLGIAPGATPRMLSRAIVTQ